MTTTEFLERFGPLTSGIGRESAAIEIYGHNLREGLPAPVWWISIGRVTDEFDTERKREARRIATFDVVDGQMVNVKPLGDAAVRDWERVKEALGL